MDDGLLNKPVDDTKPTDDSQIKADDQKKIDEALSKLPGDLEKPITPPASTPPTSPTATPPAAADMTADPQTPPATPPANPTDDKPMPPPPPSGPVEPIDSEISETPAEPPVAPPPPPPTDQPTVPEEKPETVKPPSKLKQGLKKNGKKIAVGALMLALLAGGGLVGKSMIQQRQVVESEAVKGGRKNITDVWQDENGKWWATTDGTSKSLLKDNDPAIKDECEKNSTEKGCAEVLAEAEMQTVDPGWEVEQQGRTLYVTDGSGKKRVISIKNDDVWRAIQMEGIDSFGQDVDGKPGYTINDFNMEVYKAYIKDQVVRGVEGLTIVECVNPDGCLDCTGYGEIGGVNPADHGVNTDACKEGSGWVTVVKTGADAWAYIEKVFEATGDVGNIYWCPDGFKDKRTCNDNQSSLIDADKLFFALTGSGEKGGEVCGAFQTDYNFSGTSAEQGGAITGFEIPCEEGDGGNGDGEDKYSCVNLASDPAAGTIELNDTVSFSCQGSFSGYSPIAYFRYSKDDGATYTEEGVAHDLTTTNPATMDLTIDDYGDWIVECQVCTDDTQASCTTWGLAN